MFCENCGKPIDVDQKLCPDCAARAQAENEAQTIVLDQEVQTPKKKKSGLLIGIVAAVLAVAVLAVVLCMGPLKGMWIKTFGSPAEYLLYVEEKAASEGVQNFVTLYGKGLKSTAGLDACTVDSKAHLLIGEKLLTLLEQSLAAEGVDMQLDFLADIAINANTGWDQDQFSAKIDLGLGDKSVIGLDIFGDTNEEKIFVGLPVLSSQYMQMPLDNAAFPNPSATYEAFRLLPAADNLGAVLDTYGGIMRKHMDKVEMSTETVTVEGISQELTVLTLTVTAEDLGDMIIEILETAQTDKDLEAVLDAMSDYVNAVFEQQFASYQGVPGLEDLIPEEVDLHAEMLDGIPGAIEQIREDESTLEDGNYLQICNYVDNGHNICGRAVEMFTENVSDGTIHYLTVTDGSKCAMELDMTPQLYVSGEYTNNDGAITGAFDITVENVNYMTVELTDCSMEKLQLKLKPTDAFLTDVLELDSDMTAVLGIASPYLEILSSGNEEASKVEMYLKAGDAMLMGITSDSTLKKEVSIAAPQGPFVNGEDEQALIDWTNGMNIDALLENLKNAGIPEELIQMLIMSLMGA